MIKNTLLDKLENPESLKKVATVRELFNKCAHSLPGFAEGILQVVLFTVSWFKWSKKNCVAKVLLIIWEIFLHGNNCNYHSYGFSYKFVFILFLSFLTNQKQELGFQEVGSPTIFLFFVYSESRSTSKPPEFNSLL